MEIERKFLLTTLPENLSSYPSHFIQQGYLCTNPVVRIRKQDSDYILTYKGSGLMIRQEENLPLTQEAYEHLLTKTDGNIITKRRYVIPIADGLAAELDVFEDTMEGLIMAEVEFPTEASANAFLPPKWFGKEVTQDPAYHNSNMSRRS